MTSPDRPAAGGRPLRLAVFGFVDENLGSLCAGHYLALRELLARGHRADLYAIEGWVTPGRLAELPTLRYLPVRPTVSQPVWRRLARLPAGPVRVALETAYSQVARRLDYRSVGQTMCAEHRTARYDALFVLGQLSPWRLPGVRTVSWSQGTPNGEVGWIVANARTLARHAGPHHPPALAAWYYGFRYPDARFDLRQSDLILCGSRWAVESWRRFGVPLRKLVPMPYPIDLDRFRPAPPPAGKPAEEFLFLHLGRLVPRKRFDLLLEGFARLVRDEPAARLLVVGQFGYAGGYRRLLDRADLMRNVEYRPAVPKAEVPALLARADAVVQPSEHENYGSAVTEAQASGRPVVVGPSNGTKDYIAPSSVVFADYTPDAVAAGMREVMRRVQADRVGVRADSRRAAEEYVSPGRVADLLEPLLRGRGPA